MAFTKVRGRGVTTTDNYTVGVITATKFVGPITGGGGDIQVGLLTATGLDINGDADISGNLTVGGDFTTLNTTLREVELLHVDANSSATAGIITQTGAGDILNLFDNNAEVLTVIDGGSVGIGTTNPLGTLHVQSNNPSIKLTDANQSTNNKSWNISAGVAQKLRIQAIQDGGGGGSQYFDFYRDGTKVEEFRGVKSGTPWFVVNNNDQKVGIGSSSPSKTLDITGSLQVKDAGGKIGLLLDPATGDFQVNQSVASWSNTGIDPVALLRWGWAGATGNYMYMGSGGNDAVASQMALLISGESGFKVGRSAWDGTDGDISSSNEFFRISKTGKVGIGTSGPDHNLHVYQDAGDAVISIESTGDGNDAALEFIRTSSGGDSKGAGAIYVTGDTGASEAKMYFGVGHNIGHGQLPRMTIMGNGEVGIGTVNPEYKLELHGAGGVTDLKIGTRMTASDYGIAFGYFDEGGGKHGFGIDRKQGGTKTSNVFVVRADSGKVGIGSVIPTATLETFHDGTSGYIFRAMADLGSNERTYDLKPPSSDSQTEPFSWNTGNAHAFQIDGTEKFQITSTGTIQCKGETDILNNILRVTDGTPRIIMSVPSGGLDTRFFNDGSGNFIIGHGDNSDTPTERLKINSSGKTIFSEEIETPQDYPIYRPTLDLNFAAVKKLDPRITYQRTGPASYTDEFGIVKLVGGNTPRFDHDPETRECKGLLIEEGRTNLLPYSTDVVDNSNWSRAGVLTENTTAVKAPDGSYDAIALRDNGANSQHTLYEDVGIADITDVYTSSCWIKAGSKSFAGLFQNGTGASGTVTIGYKFNLTTGATTYVGSGGFESGTSATATKYPNGWWRCTVTCDVSDSASGSGTFRWHVRPREDGAGNYQGDNSIGIYVWGLQLEKGTFPTSYIPGSGLTDGDTSTRGADLALIDGEEFTEFFNQDEGTINCAYWIGNDNIGLRVFQINDSNNSVIDIVAGSGSGNGGYGYVNTGGVAQANGGQSTTNANNLNTLHVTTLAYKENDVAGINIKTGVLTNDTSATLDGAYNRVTFYQGANGVDQLNGHLQRVQYYPKRLPDNQLKNLNNQ